MTRADFRKNVIRDQKLKGRDQKHKRFGSLEDAIILPLSRCWTGTSDRCDRPARPPGRVAPREEGLLEAVKIDSAEFADVKKRLRDADLSRYREIEIDEINRRGNRAKPCGGRAAATQSGLPETHNVTM